MRVSVSWEWSDKPELVVEPNGDGLHVRAHPGLSQAQVRLACEELGEHAEAVYQAWGQAVGLI